MEDGLLIAELELDELEDDEDEDEDEDDAGIVNWENIDVIDTTNNSSRKSLLTEIWCQQVLKIASKIAVFGSIYIEYISVYCGSRLYYLVIKH